MQLNNNYFGYIDSKSMVRFIAEGKDLKLLK